MSTPDNPYKSPEEKQSGAARASWISIESVCFLSVLAVFVSGTTWLACQGDLGNPQGYNVISGAPLFGEFGWTQKNIMTGVMTGFAFGLTPAFIVAGLMWLARKLIAIFIR